MSSLSSWSTTEQKRFTFWRLARTVKSIDSHHVRRRGVGRGSEQHKQQSVALERGFLHRVVDQHAPILVNGFGKYNAHSRHLPRIDPAGETASSSPAYRFSVIIPTAPVRFIMPFRRRDFQDVRGQDPRAVEALAVIRTRDSIDTTLWGGVHAVN